MRLTSWTSLKIERKHLEILSGTLTLILTVMSLVLHTPVVTISPTGFNSITIGIVGKTGFMHQVSRSEMIIPIGIALTLYWVRHRVLSAPEHRGVVQFQSLGDDRCLLQLDSSQTDSRRPRRCPGLDSMAVMNSTELVDDI